MANFGCTGAKLEAKGRWRSRPRKDTDMNGFEKIIKQQILAYKAEIDEAMDAGQMDRASSIRTQMSAYRLGLETCLNKNYVATFFEYIENFY